MGPLNPVTVPLSLTDTSLLLSVIPSASRALYLSYNPMDDYFLGQGRLRESPPRSPRSRGPPSAPSCLGSLAEDSEEDLVRSLLRFVELEREAKDAQEGKQRRVLVVRLQKEVERRLCETDKEIEIMRSKLGEMLGNMSLDGEPEKVKKKKQKNKKKREKRNSRSIMSGGMTIRELVTDHRCRLVHKQIRRLEGRRNNLNVVKEECERKLSCYAKADPVSNLQERFQVLEALFSGDRRPFLASESETTRGLPRSSLCPQDDFLSYDSPSSLGRSDASSAALSLCDDELQVNPFAQAATLLSQLDKLLRDTEVASASFQLATEALSAALWQLRRTPAARLLEVRLGEDHLSNSRLDTAQKHLGRAKQHVLKALRFAAAAQLPLAARSEEDLDRLFQIARPAGRPAGRSLRRSAQSITATTAGALEAVRQAAAELELFVADAQQDRAELHKALAFEQERVVEYRSALIKEHVLGNRALAKHLACCRAPSAPKEPQEKISEKRASNRDVRVQSFE